MNTHAIIDKFRSEIRRLDNLRGISRRLFLSREE